VPPPYRWPSLGCSRPGACTGVMERATHRGRHGICRRHHRVRRAAPCAAPGAAPPVSVVPAPSGPSHTMARAVFRFLEGSQKNEILKKVLNYQCPLGILAMVSTKGSWRPTGEADCAHFRAARGRSSGPVQGQAAMAATPPPAPDCSQQRRAVVSRPFNRSSRLQASASTGGCRGLCAVRAN
jgi:hypothetical protein